MMIFTYQSVSEIMLVQVLRRHPNISIRGKVDGQSRQWLPSHDHCAVGRLIEELPAKGCLIPRDVWRLHQPVGDLMKLDVRVSGISSGRDQVNMGDLGSS